MNVKESEVHRLCKHIKECAYDESVCVQVCVCACMCERL